MAADRDGNIFVGGQTDGDLFATAVGDGQDLWVAKLDGAGGELLWGYQASAGRRGRRSGEQLCRLERGGKEQESSSPGRAPPLSPSLSYC